MRISQRLSSVLTLGDKAARAALVTERCEGLSLFQGTDQETAD